MQDYLEDYLEELYENREFEDLEETEDAFEMWARLLFLFLCKRWLNLDIQIRSERSWRLRRYSPGVVPAHRLKARWKAPGVENPSKYEISPNDSSVLRM